MATKSKTPTMRRLHCNECRQETRHQLLHKQVDEFDQKLSFDDDEETFSSVSCVATLELFQCRGCGAGVLRRTSVVEQDPDTFTQQYFPPPVSRHPPTWLWKCPGDLNAVMKEVYRSLDGNNRRLPMMGARTLIDLLMSDKVGDIGTFGDKLKRLEALGVISSQNRVVLAAALDVGSAAAHRGHAPGNDEVNAVMDIVENVLHAVYILPDMAKTLREKTPGRPAKTKTTP
jgi:hypothetical protein